MIFKNLSCPTIPQYVLRKAILAILFLGWTSVAKSQQRIDLTDRYSGKVADQSLADVRPDSGIINTPADWKKLWDVWRPNQPIKEIDFENQLVLVETAPGLVFASLLELDDQGDLKYEIASTQLAGPGFAYLVMVVPKVGIKSVNGKTLDGRHLEPKPKVANPVDATPDSQPENRTPETIQPESDPKTRVGIPGVDPNTYGVEFIQVDIVGRVRTQFQSVGAETTGTLVAANGIVWELDLQEDTKLREAARGLGDSLARIKGNLDMQRQRGSIEARVRWIVRVESLEPLSFQPTIPPASSPTENPNFPPRVVQPVADNAEANPVPTIGRNSDSSASRSQPPIQSIPQPVPDSVATEAPIISGFKQLSIVTSDGQTQLINSDGTVHYESPSRNLSNEWQTDPMTIAKLHRFVAETSWSQVPKKTRSESRDPNEISYSISIETNKGMTRIFIDRTAVPGQPTMKQLFEIIGEIARNRQQESR